MSWLVVLLLSSCDSEKRAASALISDRGVEVSEAALFDALDSGDVSLAEALVISDVDPDARDSMERTPVMMAAGGEGASLVPLLAAEGADLEATDATGRTALGYAVEAGNRVGVVAFLDAGASHELRDLCGQKSLHIAVARGHTDMVGLLLDKGADPNEPFQERLSETFLDLVNSDGIGRWALKKSNTFYPIMLASDSGSVEIARQLIDHGCIRVSSSAAKKLFGMTKVGDYVEIVP